MHRQIFGYIIAGAGIALALFTSSQRGSIDLLNAHGSVGPTSNPPKIHTAYFGYNNCSGVNDTNQKNSNIDEAQAAGCRVVNVPGTTTLATNVITSIMLTGTCQPQGSVTADKLQRLDAMPVTFSGPVEAASLKPSAFTVTLSNNEKRQPICVTLSPAAEQNERETVLIMGDFGEPSASGKPYPKQLTVTGVQVQTPGAQAPVTMASTTINVLDYAAFPILLGARLTAFSAVGDTGGRTGLNHCRVNFPATTHVIQLLWSGGVTRDGVNSLLPNEAGLFKSATASGLFNIQVRNPTGAIVDYYSVTGVKILGLADLGSSQPVPGQFWVHDGDNYLDICLSLAADYDPAKIANVVLDPNNSAGLKLYDPTGDTPNVAQTVAVTR